MNDRDLTSAADAGDDAGTAAEPTKDFYSLPARPRAVVFAVVGIVGFAAAYHYLDNWFAYAVCAFVFGGFMLAGVPAAIRGGKYRSWFADEELHWEYPEFFFFRSDSCRLDEIVEFQEPLDAEGTPMQLCRLLLADGTTKDIPEDCYGSIRGFFFAIRRGNPAIAEIKRIS